MNKTWLELAADFQKELAVQYPQEEIKQLFLWIFEHLTGKKALHYALTANVSLDEHHLQAAIDYLQQLKTNKPIQLILGEAHFYGQVFDVSEHTLIPRPETEELVHLIIQENKGKPNLNIIDIGTGTACIPISLALKLPATYSAIEIDTNTIQIAKRNDAKFNTGINFIQADILEWEILFDRTVTFDIIVSNPPYITNEEKTAMHSNVLQFEPHLALFVEDEAPLLFYDHIADFALAHLSTDGTLYFEINQYLSHETADLLRKKGFQSVQIIKDINGADRMIRAKRTSSLKN